MTAIPGVAVHDLGREKSGIVSFSKQSEAPDALVARMAGAGVNIHTSTVQSTRIDMEGRGLDEINRLGVHCYNSEAELDRFLELLAAA